MIGTGRLEALAQGPTFQATVRTDENLGAETLAPLILGRHREVKIKIYFETY